ncbi:hypothetical protein E2P81_ATG01101 [Venturia nashicola]|uniref:Uncharacterized protein n=1 Tax=Venturia nashicola TaxID=86259 RepID=A0A4Z1PDK9_9PEZI|nr:hypothetical protein E6O75_ATG01126 [Venturia nashicola]TLD38558.1 hypothetical protein E2P81_ATG01101 [Venturia nashicola]
MDIFKAVFCCFNSEDDPAFKPLVEKQPMSDGFTKSAYDTFDLKAYTSALENTAGYAIQALPPPYISQDYSCRMNEKKIADSIVTRLYAADTRDALRDEFRAQDWTNTLARHILDGLVSTINSGKVMGGAVKEAYDKVAPQVEDFVREHPVLTAVMAILIAICILEYLVPWAVAALGFGELGPIEGSFAAWWQSLYGDVPYGSLISLLQRFGMRFGKTACVNQEELDKALNEQRVDGNHVAEKYTDEGRL